MTTYTFSGYAAKYQYDYLFDNETILAVEEVQLVVVTPDATTLSYTYTGDGNSPLEVDTLTTTGDLYEMYYTASWGTDYPGYYDGITEFATVSFSNGNVSNLMQMTLNEYMEGFVEYGTFLLFHLDGDALPDLASVSAFASFGATVDTLDPISTGAFAAGEVFSLLDLNPDSVSEDDEVFGSNGRDVLNTGVGDDLINSSRGNDVYKGGTGFDVVIYANDKSGVQANLATGLATDGWGHTDKLFGIEALAGSRFADNFVGDNRSNDFAGFKGADTFDGGAGSDSVFYESDADMGGRAGVTVKLNEGFAIDGFGDRDSFTNIENAYGTAKSDLMIGNGKANELVGNGGKDVLKGLNGNDLLEGGQGDDVLFGGRGADMFKFENSNYGNDVIRDFNAAQGDTLLLQMGNITNFADLMANHIEEVGGDLVITDNSSAVITIRNAALADVSSDWFVF